MISLIEVRHKCKEERFFPYDDWRDKLFVPPAIFCVWIFVNLGWSGNAVSWLSGVVTILGGMLIATNNKVLILLGACSYALFYFLDYVDGGVARFRNAQGVAGQYIDWIMHVISAVSIATGLFIGALQYSQKIWLIPFGFLFILASVLALDRFSLGWWAICMYRQQSQNRTKAAVEAAPMSAEANNQRKPFGWRLVGRGARILFHENYAIFILPCLAALNMFAPDGYIFDFRFLLTLLGGTIYFAFVVHEIVLLAKNKMLEAAYRNLFDATHVPDLPAEHFFK